MNITAPKDKLGMAARLLAGDPLVAFENFRKALRSENENGVNIVFQNLSDYIFPKKALRYQKRYMRRFIRKPKEVKIKDYVARMQQINEYLVQFPPGNEDQKLPDDELLDILEFAIPNSWTKEFTKIGFDAADHSIKDFIKHCERLELTESWEFPSKKKANGQNAKHQKISDEKAAILQAKSSAEVNKNLIKNNKRKFCDLHNQFGHSTVECKVVQSQIQKMKSAWQAKSTVKKLDNFCYAKKQKQEKQDLAVMSKDCMPPFLHLKKNLRKK